MKTIFAQSTGRGKAGVAVIRISGPDALGTLQKLTDRQEFEPNRMYLAELRMLGGSSQRHPRAYVVRPGDLMTAEKSSIEHDPYVLRSPRFCSAKLEDDAYLIDKAMAVYFRAPHSFTGEDVVELHTHGSIAVIRMLTTALLDLGLSLAEPGEFSKRAFLNGKMDLTSAEGLADLIDSETEMQHRQAMRHMSGEFEALCNDWREKLLKSLGLMEAYIDFPDEEIPASVLDSTQKMIDELKISLEEKLGDNRRGERLRNGITMAVLGEPNVGKSSLMNFLSQRDVSIISDIAGTTRDVVETHLDIGGYPIILADTAGLRGGSDDVIEKEGMARALKAASAADIKIVMLDARRIDNTAREILDLIDDSTIVVVNKVDLVDLSVILEDAEGGARGSHDRRGELDQASLQSHEIPEMHFMHSRMTLARTNLLHVSIKQKLNLDALISAITTKAESLVGNGETISITRERHRKHITMAVEALERCDIKDDLVLAAEDLRIAARNLSLMTGKIEVEEILGEIFQNFCIGK